MQDQEYHGLVSGEKKYPFFHPTRAAFRYTILLIISLMCFGNYFAYDEIEPLEQQINKALNINHAQFGLLYSVYSIPNMVLVFFGGILGDKIGLRLAALIYSSLVCAGAVLTALGPSLVHVTSPTAGYIITVFGRVIFGMGAESLNVIQTSMVALWFSGGTELAMALGLVLSMSRLGDFLALSLSANIASWSGDFRVTLWIGAILCGVSFAAIIIYAFMDKYAEYRIPDRKPLDPSENELNFKAIFRFDARFWLVSFLCMTYYSGVLPFVAVCSDFLTTKYGYSQVTAGWYTSIVTLSSMILSPILGKVLDIFGNRPYFVVLGSLVIIPSHLLLGFTGVHEFPPLAGIIIIGLSFSLVPSALWPSIPLIVDKKEIATAYGLMTAIQNAGLALMNYIAGLIADKKGYEWVMVFFAGMDALGLLIGILLIIVDARKQRVLCAVTKKPKTEEQNVN